MGFDDGVVRIICVNLDTHYRGERVTLLQSWKPHRKAVTVMSINPRESLLVTGSADSTIFIHQIVGQEPFVTFLPIGFVDLPSEATALNWKPNMVGPKLFASEDSLNNKILLRIVLYCNGWLLTRTST